MIQYCPTAEMLADFFTKPLQGALFTKFRKVLMGWEHINTLKKPSEYDLKERVGTSNNYEIVSSNSIRKKTDKKVGKQVSFHEPPLEEKSTNVIMKECMLDGSDSKNDI